MFFTKNTNLFGERLEVFRPCFSKPQWMHFKTYLHGLLLGDKGEKNIEDIAGNVLDGKHQSSLNRFLTKRRWDLKKLNSIRLRETLHDRNGGVLALDDMLIEKFGKMMDGVGYLMDHCSGRTVLCHDVVSAFYHHGKQSLPLYFQPYLKKDVTEDLDLWFNPHCVLSAVGDKHTALQTRRFASCFYKIHHAKPEKFRTYHHPE